MNLSKNDIRKLLSDIPEFDYEAQLTLHYLTPGITNKSYYLKLADSEYVLRINNPESDRLGLDRAREIKIMSDVASLELAPVNIYYHETSNFFLSKWIPGETWSNQQIQKQVNLNRLAQQLKQLHNLPCQSLPRVDLLKRLAHYRSMILARHSNLPAIEQRLLSYTLNSLIPKLCSPSLCLCHNDLLSVNILESKNHHIHFLDWEYAAVNEPMFELAVICRGNQLTAENQQYFLQAYLGENFDQFVLDFDAWCWFYDYLSLLWGLVILPKDCMLPESLDRQLQQLMDKLPL